jgi:O-antigen/teichoic acid export membrane protein
MGLRVMGQFKRNIWANLLGNGWVALTNFAFIPLYIHFLGIEAYGLIGIFATLQAVFSLLDMGLSGTLNREMAKLSVLPEGPQKLRNLLRTLEVVYWGVAVLIGIATFALSPLIAHHWVQTDHLSPGLVQQTIKIMGLALALQCPYTLYAGGLMGLQRQVRLNGILVGIATLRSIGIVAILWLVSPTIQAFFICQILISGLQTLLVNKALWGSLPTTDRKAAFNKDLFRDIWRFAAGLSGITIMTVLLTQMDKIILSKLVPLEKFAYYSLASAVAMSLYRLIAPVFNATYPRLTQLVALGEQEELKQFYHSTCQLMSVFIIPIAVIGALFAPELLLLWTRNPDIVANTHTVLSLLIIGTALNGLMNIPYALQLAHGWTSLAFYSSILAAIILAPLLVFITRRYGLVGTATVWVLLNSGHVLITMQIMQRYLLRGELRRWYVEDIGLPLVAALPMAILGKWLIGPHLATAKLIVSLAILSLATATAAVFASKYTRGWLVTRILKLGPLRSLRVMLYGRK